MCFIVVQMERFNVHIPDIFVCRLCELPVVGYSKGFL